MLMMPPLGCINSKVLGTGNRYGSQARRGLLIVACSDVICDLTTFPNDRCRSCSQLVV